MSDAPDYLNFAYHEFAATLKQDRLIKCLHKSCPRRQIVINTSSSLRVNVKCDVKKLRVRILVIHEHFRFDYVLESEYFARLVVLQLLHVLNN